MAADGLARTGYQIGKTPLLPLYAAMLGASDLIVGYVVSISTLSGLILKPVVGALSDRGGRRVWLLLGLVIFAMVPFLYRYVQTPQDLYALRLIHGTATAIFGPVSLAYVAEMTPQGRAERLGIFGMTRSASYLLGPIIGAVLLTIFPPEQVFTLIGFLSCCALLPAMGLREAPSQTRHPKQGFATVVRNIRSSRSFWLVAALEIVVHMATYALKAFLPIYALRALGLDLIVVGVFFTIQEAAHMLVRPVAGRLADKYGPLQLIGTGFVVLASALLILGLTVGTGTLLLSAIGVGTGLGLILPSTLSLMSVEISPNNLGAGMGALGALRNLAKVLGPVLAGIALTNLSYQQLFTLTGLMLATVAFSLVFLGRGSAQGMNAMARKLALLAFSAPRKNAQNSDKVRMDAGSGRGSSPDPISAIKR